MTKLFKTFALLELMRLNRPAGYLLVFYTAFYGQCLASRASLDLVLTMKLFIGAVLTRSAGCIINDLLDRKFDMMVTRTQNRPLVIKTVSIELAIAAFTVLMIASLCLLITLPVMSIYFGALVFFLIIFYPLMKRITFLPQFFLGITFNGSLISYSAASGGQVSLAATLMYLACCFWIIGFDTIYGYMDIRDDKLIGLKSAAILLEHRNPKLWLYGFYGMFIFLFVLSYALSGRGISGWFLLNLLFISYNLIWQVRTLDIYDPKNCLVRFKSNSTGAGLYLALTLIEEYF